MFEHWIKSDVRKLAKVESLSGVVFSQDSTANRIGAIVTDNGAPIILTGSVTASIIKPDGETLTVNGTKEGNRAWVDLPSEAYSKVGKIGIFIRITNGSEVSTLGGIEAYVYRSMTEVMI